MSCPNDQTLKDFVAARLESVEEDTLSEHIAVCAECRRRVEELEREDDVHAGIRAGLLHSPKTPSNDELDDLLKMELPDSDPAPESSSRIPESIGNYKILDILGSGGMGTVYRAVNPHLDRPAAIKVVKPSRSMRKSSVERFHRELIANGKLRHENIVDAFDAGTFENRPYLVMELLDGTDLARYVQENGPLPVREACEIIRQAALGLQCAHENGLVHRDIKPSNLFRTKDGKVKILDLGLARLLETETEETDQIVPSSPDATSEGQILGSPDYMSPEQAVNAKSVDHRSDLYSLGCTFFYLLTGTPPFGESTELLAKIDAHAKKELPPLKTFRNDVPPVIENLLRKMTAKKSEDRPGSALEIEKILERFLRPLWKRFVPVAVILLIFLAIMGIYSLVQPKPKPIILPPERIEVPVEKLPDLTFDWMPIQTIQTGSAPINSAFFTPDGNGIIEGRSDGDVFLWDVESGKQLYFFEKTNSPIHSLFMSRDGKLLAAGCQNGFVIVWNAMSGKLKDGFRFNNDSIASVCFSMDNTRMFATSSKQARIWRITDGETLQTVDMPENNIVQSMFSPDGNEIYCSRDRSVFVFDSITLTEKSASSFGFVTPLLKYSTDLNWLAVCDGTDTLKLIPRSGESWQYDFRSENRGIKTISSSGFPIIQVAFSPDSRLLATAETNGSTSLVRFWNLETGEIGQTFSLETDSTPITSLEFSQDGKRLLIRSSEGLLTVFEQPNAKLPTFKPTPVPTQISNESRSEILPEKSNLEKLGSEYGAWKLERSLPGTMGDLNSAFFIFDGREAFDVQSSGIFQRWFLNGSRSEQMKINFPITAFALSYDRTTFAYACKINPKDNSAQKKERWCAWVGNVKTGKTFHSINPVSTQKGPVTTLAFSLDKKRLFIGGSGAEVWELPVVTTGHSVLPDGTKSETKTYQRGNLRPMLRLSEEVGTVLAATFSPDGKDILFGNDKNFLFRYSSDENIERETPRKLADMASCIKYGNDFRRLYIADETERIYVFSWDNESGLAHREEDDLVHPRQNARILTLALSPDNERLLFGGPNTFGIWNLATKKVETSLPILTDESIIALDYTPDGKTFLAREKENGKIQLWKNDSATSAAVPILKIPEQAPLPALSAAKPSKKLPDVWSPPPFRSSK